MIFTYSTYVAHVDQALDIFARLFRRPPDRDPVLSFAAARTPARGRLVARWGDPFCSWRLYRFGPEPPGPLPDASRHPARDGWRDPLTPWGRTRKQAGVTVERWLRRATALHACTGELNAPFFLFSVTLQEEKKKKGDGSTRYGVTVMGSRNGYNGQKV